MRVEWGATRTVILIGRYAIKLPGEIKESSLGWVDGRLVITDYGN